MSPTEAAGKARGELGQDVLGIGKTAIGAVQRMAFNPEQLMSDVKNAPEMATQAVQSIKNLPQHYYENPDVLATDVASVAPGLELGIAKGLGESRRGNRSRQ